MKKFSIIFFLFFVTTGLFAQNRVLTVGNGSTPNETVLLNPKSETVSIQFNLNSLELFEVTTDYGQMFIPISGDAPWMMQEGAPELFYLTTSFIIPDVGGSELQISYGSFTDYENIEIAPSKGNLSRSVDPATVPFVKGEVYNQNAFFPGTLASLREPFIMRDVRGQSVDVYPIQYNPVTKVLRVYSDITVNVINTQEQGINEFTTQKRHNSIDPTFNAMYQRLFINHGIVQQRGYPTGEEGELLIICHTAFADAMQPYVDWKRTIGRKTTLVTTAETGSTNTAIKNYITSFYNSPDHNLAFVLLVGDNAQIPHIGTSSVPSDIKYAQLASGNYLDFLIGRMSAENTTHVQTQVQRSIEYERDMTTADTWIPKAVGLATYEGAGGGHSGEADYVHMNNIRNRLLNYGYDPVYQEYTYNIPGITPTTVAQISQRFNDGVSMANYCNHGSMTAWTLSYNPGAYQYLTYSNTHVNQLQNAGKLPFIFSVACNNGEFNSGTCFAEAWLRANQGGQPTGAIATLMATISLGWQPPMYAQDEFVNVIMDLPSPYGNNCPTMRTIAGAMLNATQKMQMVSPSLNDYNSWTVFGDPTLQFRTKTPQEMVVSHLPTIPAGAESFNVECDADDATAALSYIDENGEVILLGAATVTGGSAEIIITETVSPGMELTVAVTGFNKVTYLSEPVYVGGELVLNEPTNLTSSVEYANHVQLGWDEPEEGTLPVKGYNIYRDNELITPEPVKEDRSYTDVVSANGEYKYEVTAVYNLSGSLESERSAPLTVVIDGMCVPFSNEITVSEDKDNNLIISWEMPNYEGIELAGYYVYRDNEQVNEEIIPFDLLFFVDETLETGTNYCYFIEAVYNDCEEPVKSNVACHTLSIDDISATQFQIFPNPTTGELKVESQKLKVESIEIFDIYGRKLSTFDLQLSTNINISHFPAGIYFVKINGLEVKRLVLIK